VTHANEVLPAIDAAVGAREEGQDSAVANLGQHLRNRVVLLLLDNFEHVISAGPHIAEFHAHLTGPLPQFLPQSRGADVKGNRSALDECLPAVAEPR
jgi:hypothetical protein